MTLRNVSAALSALFLVTSASLVGCGDDDPTPTPDTADTTPTEDVVPGEDTTPGEDTLPSEDIAPDTDVHTDPGLDVDTDVDADVGPGDDTTEPAAATYQVWATDQGLSRVLVWEPAAGEAFDLVATIDYVDLYPDESEGPKPRTPHMIDFSPDKAYAFIAHTSSGHTTVIRTSDYTVVAVLSTGPGTHMARVSPTGNVYVDVIGNSEFPGRILQLSTDYENETFAVERTLIVSADPAFDSTIHPSSSPVCGVSTPDDSHQFVTFGPGFGGAMLARIDNDTFTIEHIYDPTVIRANCGSITGPDGNLYFTGGAAATTEAPGVGVWYIIDGTTFEAIPVAEDGPVERSTEGTDAHGLNFTADGSELWFFNRDSSNVTIFDTADFTLKEDLDDLFDSPDIADISPDGRYFFVTLRGPDPRSGPHAIAGTTPAVAVVDIAEREVKAVLTEADLSETEEAGSDFHGLRVLVFPTVD